MCEHEFDEFVVGKPTTWGLQALRFVDMCIFCGESRYEVNLKEQLAAANARVAEMEGQVNRLHECLIFDGECIGKYQTARQRLREALEEIANIGAAVQARQIAKTALEGDQRK